MGLARLTWSVWLKTMLEVPLRQLRRSPKVRCTLGLTPHTCTHTCTLPHSLCLQQNSTVPRGLTALGNVNYKKVRRLAKKTQLYRGTSFQDNEANLYSMKYYTYELGHDNGDDGGILLRSNRVDRLYSQEAEEELNIDFHF